MSFSRILLYLFEKVLSCKRCSLSISVQKQHFPYLPADACYIFGVYQSCKIPEIKLNPSLTSARSLTSLQSPRHNATIATTTPSQPLLPPQLSQTPMPYSTMRQTCTPLSPSSCDVENINARFNNARRASHPPHHLAILSGFEKFQDDKREVYVPS